MRCVKSEFAGLFAMRWRKAAAQTSGEWMGGVAVEITVHWTNSWGAQATAKLEL